MKNVSPVLSILLIYTISLYQRVLSPDHSFWAKLVFPNGYCKFYPTCSNYARTAVSEHGTAKGVKLALTRLFKCHPWSAGGFDYVPDTHQR